MAKRARTTATEMSSGGSEIGAVDDACRDQPPATRPSLVAQLAHIRQFERPWTDEEVERVRAELSPSTMRELMAECFRSMNRDTSVSLRFAALLTRLCDRTLGPTEPIGLAVPTAVQLPTAVWAHALSWCTVRVKYKLLLVSHAFLRIVRTPAAWTGGVRLSNERDAAVKLMRMFPEAPRLAARIAARVALDVEDSPSGSYLGLGVALAYFAPHPNPNVRDAAFRRFDGGALLPTVHARIAAAFPRLTRLAIVGPYSIAARHVQLFLDRVPTLRVFELRRGGSPLRTTLLAGPRSVWLPPTLREYRDYIGASTVCVGPRDARHDTRRVGLGDSDGDGESDDEADRDADGDESRDASVLELPTTTTTTTTSEYALQLLHLARGARIESPATHVSRLARLSDVYYTQSSALEQRMRIADRRVEWEQWHALVHHPSLTRLHCTPIDVGQTVDSDGGSSDDERQTSAETKPARRVQQLVLNLSPLPATHPRIERLSLQLHREMPTAFDPKMFAHLRDLRIYVQSASDEVGFDLMLATLADSVASKSGGLEYAQFSSRFGCDHLQFGFSVNEAAAAAEEEEDEADGERKRQEANRRLEPDGDDGHATDNDSGGDSDPGDSSNGGIAQDLPVTHAFLWLVADRRTIVLLPHTHAHDTNLHAAFAGRRSRHGAPYRRLGVDRIGASLALLLRRRTIVALGSENLDLRPSHPRPRLVDAIACASDATRTCYCDATASVVGARDVSDRVGRRPSSSAGRCVARSTSFAAMCNAQTVYARYDELWSAVADMRREICDDDRPNPPSSPFPSDQGGRSEMT